MIFRTTYGNFHNFNAFKTKENYNNLYKSLFMGGITNEVYSV